MNTKLTFSHSLYEKIKESHKSYAKKILHELYPDNLLNQLNILSKFPKKHSKVVQASLKDLEGCNLIMNINKSKSLQDEKLYILTNFGKQLFEEDSNLL